MRNDGGPAFPMVTIFPAGEDNTGTSHYGGMSLRDWFAGQALPGVVREFGSSAELRAHRCYEYADAMLAEREKS